MRKAATIFVVVSLVAMAFSGFQPSTADPGAEEIGEYKKLGFTNDLTEEHLTRESGALEVEAPSLTSSLHVETDFLEEELGAWGSLEEFTPGEGEVEFGSREAYFVELNVNETPVYTWGSKDQVEFLERPMWLSSSQEEHGGEITLTMDDDDSSGQEIYISKDWLWMRGIHRPNATHEDGTVLAVNHSEDRKGFIIDMHHFSEVYVYPADLDIKGRQGGVVSPHLEDRRWYSESERLEVDVDAKLTTYELLIEKDWTDMNLVYPALLEREWTVEEVQDEVYYVVEIPPAGEDIIVEMMNFTADDQWVYTSGSPFTFYLFGKPKFISIDTPAPGEVVIETDVGSDLVGNATGNIGINGDHAAALGIDKPEVEGPNGTLKSVGVSGRMIQFHLEPGVHNITQGTTFPLGLEDEECLNTEKLLHSWEGDSGHDASWADLYRIESGVFCFEWYMKSTETASPWSAGPAFYLAFMSVWDDSDDDIHCDFGNAGEGGDDGSEFSFYSELLVAAGVSVKGQEGAALCEWPETEEVGSVIVARFHGHALSKTRYEERYSGQKSWKDCYTGDIGGSELPIALWVIVAPLVLAVGEAIIYCAGEWSDKGISKIFYDDDEERENEAIITRDDAVITHEITVSLIDENERRDDTWDELETHPLCLRTLDWRGNQELYWTVENVKDTWFWYKSDFSKIRDIPEGQDSDDYYIEGGWQYSTQFVARAEDDVDELDTYFETTLDWQAQQGLPLGGGDPLGLPKLWITVIDPPEPPEVPPWEETVAITYEPVDDPDPEPEDPYFTSELLDGGDWVEEAIVSFSPNDIEETYLNFYANGTDEWAFVRTFLDLATSNETIVNETGYQLELAEDPLEYFNETGLNLGVTPSEFEYESPFSVKSVGRSTFNPSQSVSDEELKDFLIYFQYVPIIEDQVC